MSLRLLLWAWNPPPKQSTLHASVDLHMDLASLCRSHNVGHPGHRRGLALRVKTVHDFPALKLPMPTNSGNETMRPRQLKQHGKLKRHGKQDGKELTQALKLHMNSGDETTRPTQLGRHGKLERHRKQLTHAFGKNLKEEDYRPPVRKPPSLRRKQQGRQLRLSCSVVSKRKMKQFVLRWSRQQQRGQQQRAAESRMQRMKGRWRPLRLKAEWPPSSRRLGLES